MWKNEDLQLLLFLVVKMYRFSYREKNNENRLRSEQKDQNRNPHGN